MILNSHFISPFYILVQYLRSNDDSIKTKMEGKEKQTVRFKFQISKGGKTKFGFNLLLNLLNSSLFFHYFKCFLRIGIRRQYEKKRDTNKHTVIQNNNNNKKKGWRRFRFGDNFIRMNETKKNAQKNGGKEKLQIKDTTNGETDYTQIGSEIHTDIRAHCFFIFKKETKVSDTVTIFYVSMGALRI